jgi:hypothetical protein
VFTTVTEAEATQGNTSGGSADTVDPGNVIVLPDSEPTPEAVAADPVPDELAAIIVAGEDAVEAHNAIALDEPTDD